MMKRGLRHSGGGSTRDVVERELARIVRLTASSQVLCDPEFRYLEVSEPYLVTFGLARAEVLGRSHLEVFPALSTRWREIYRRALEGDAYRSDLELCVAQDGTPQWLRISATQWRRSEGDIGGILLSIEDLSVERRIRRQLVARESLLTTLFEVVEIGIAITDEDGRFLYSNPACGGLLGYSSDDLAGMFIGSAMHPDDAPHSFKVLDPVLAGVVPLGEWRSRFIRRDGQTVLVDCVMASIPGATSRCERFAVICRDASERSDLERRIREADRLSAIGLLGEALAHDLGNLLPGLHGALAGLRHSMARPPDPEAGLHGIEVVRGGTAYLEQLVEGLALLVREPGGEGEPSSAERSPTKPPAIEPGDWWQQASSLVRTAVPRSIGFEARLDPELPAVRIAAGALTQIALNLVVNAAEAVVERHGRRGGTIALELRREPTGERIALVVTDDGVGMDAAMLRRAPERGVTTRAAAGGWGIGLSLVDRLATVHGGSLHLASTPGAGTVATVVLLAAGV